MDTVAAKSEISLEIIINYVNRDSDWVKDRKDLRGCASIEYTYINSNFMLKSTFIND